MKLRTLIVEDEEPARGALLDLLAERDDVQVVGESDSVAAATRDLQRLAPDLIFLDVTLGDGDAFDLLATAPVNAHVVFLTASEEHAVRAFEVNAIDYLLKPTQPRDLERALARVHAAGRPRNDATPRLILSDRLCLRDAKNVVVCRVFEILFVRAADDYTEVHLRSGRMGLVHRRLRDWNALLPDQFARCHRSLIVNMAFVDALEQTAGGAGQVRLEGKAEALAVSRRHLPTFKQQRELQEPQRQTVH